MVSEEMGISLFLFSIMLIWSLVWKLLALWKAAEKKAPLWFVILAMVNTMGILEILYFYIFSEMKPKSKKQEKNERKIKRKRRR